MRPGRRAGWTRSARAIGTVVFLLAAATAMAAEKKAGRNARQKRPAEQRRKAAEARKREARKKRDDKKAPPKRKQPADRGQSGRRSAFSDEAVRNAIEKGKKYLWSLQRRDSSWSGRSGANNKYPVGPSALAAYALLASGVSPLEPRMQKALDWLSKQPCSKTYSLGLRANVWLLANKPTGGKYSRQLRADVSQLVRSTKDGSYNYDSRGDGKSSGDNSNSQYGVLGVWAGQMGIGEVPRQYWLTVMKHWMQCQHRDGGWCYRHGSKKKKGGGDEARATMVAAGLATLFVCFDNVYSDRFIRCDVNADFKPIRLGLGWMDRNFASALGGGKGAHNFQKHFGYFLYGVERVGLASGYKYFGTADWYKMGAERLLARQSARGSFGGGGEGGGLPTTAFALLFLVRGQHPVAFNKLEFEGDWNNRPRDMAGLTRWLSGSFEKVMNWQIINLKVPVDEWHDAPIVYLSGSTAPKFTDQQIAKLARYVWQGGTILSITECGGGGFREGIRKLYERMLPGYPLTKISREHPLYTVHDNLDGHPPFYEISNGIRSLVLHTDADLSRSWQMQLRLSASRDFKVASNVLMYVTDKGRLRNRGVSHWPRRPRGGGGKSVTLARVKHDGNWDPEPLAYERFARLMAKEAKIDLKVVGAVPIGRLTTGRARIATLTGTGALTLSAGQKASLKRYVEDGGTLIVDAAGGSRPFGESARAILREMFGATSVRRLSSSAAIYNQPGHKIAKVSYRRRARLERGLKTEPNLRGVLLDGRLAVILSTEDLTGGLVGCPSYGCVGYTSEAAFGLMRNAVLMASK